MPLRSQHIIHNLLLSSFTLWSMASCIDDTASPCEAVSIAIDAGRVEMCLEMTLYAPDAVATRADVTDTHTPIYGESYLQGTAAENEIRSITVFLVDLDDNDLDQLDSKHVQARTLYVSEATDPPSATADATSAAAGYNVTVNFKTTTGRKHVYVGANLSPEQIAAFMGGNQSLEYTDYTDATLSAVMSHFMTVSDERFTYTGSRISMFARAEATTGDDVFVVAPAAGEGAVQRVTPPAVALERTVAKVLLACKRSGATEPYAAIRDINETARRSSNVTEAEAAALEAKYRGWVHTSTMFYMLNIAARTQRLWQDSVATLGKYVTRLQNYDFVAKDEVYTHRYISYSADELSFTADNADSYPFIAGALRRRVALYDGTGSARRFYANTGSSDPGSGVETPTEGAYCLPNLFRFSLWDAGQVGTSTPEWYGADFKLDSVAQKVATYVVAAVRYIPRSVLCYLPDPATGEYALEEVRFETMEEALAMLNRADQRVPLQSVSGVETLYPEDTYWTMVLDNGAVDYYTAAAVAYCLQRDEVENWSLGRYRCYERGYGYYRSFIDPVMCQDDEDVDAPFYRKLSYDCDVKQQPSLPRAERVFGLSRNHYYVICADEITVPGSSTLSGPMCLNAVLLDWKDRGGQAETLTPGDN